MIDLSYIGRFEIRCLVKEASSVNKQPKVAAYKIEKVERPDIPNHLKREFQVEQPNQVGVVTSPAFGFRNDRYYLACFGFAYVVLLEGSITGAALAIAAPKSLLDVSFPSVRDLFMLFLFSTFPLLDELFMEI